MMVNFNEVKVIGVHDGLFHADDVLCVALVRYFTKNKEIQVIRSRQKEELTKADLICDVGFGEFDHHQEEKDRYENGVIMAACGKVANALQKAGYMTEEELETLRLKGLYSVEAFDNGMDMDELPTVYPNPFAFISVMNAIEKEGGIFSEAQQKNFEAAAIMAEMLIDRIMAAIRENIENRDILEAITKTVDGGIVIMDQFIKGWQKVFIDFNNSHDEKINVVVYPPKETQWNTQVVPKTMSFTDHSSWVSVPEEVKEIPGFVFRHTGAHLAGFATKEGAISAAKMCK